MNNQPEESTEITIFFTNGDIYQGDVLINGGWVSTTESFCNIINNHKFFKDKNGFFYPLTSISKMKDITPSELKQYIRDNKISTLLNDGEKIFPIREGVLL